MSDVAALPVLSRQAFTLANVTFLDRNGIPYTPGQVEKRVVNAANGATITDWTLLPGFLSGDDVDVTATEMEMMDASALTEKHIVLVVGDRATASENPLRVTVQVKNREKIP
jgi:hypothetical protein